eukprot:scaffold78950_cov63-Phaeocystis_antarctica.AAC.2
MQALARPWAGQAQEWALGALKPPPVSIGADHAPRPPRSPCSACAVSAPPVAHGASPATPARHVGASACRTVEP